ncbi:MAG: polysaccharide biosynthesis/export family protein [Candidatus Electrothrix sp. GW3-4]|uniref:polysaccharide biosynthesis/export family protein n=1 Tax=Candidatus Electrothrix sp. GW3-4 TaxID=3126740 RepID=UPI0030D20368
MLKRLSFFLPPLLLIISACILQSCSSIKNSQQSYTLPLPQAAEKASPLSAEPEDITLAAGDVLMINVWGQEALNKEVTLDATGNIYYPFIGKIKASGKTIEELQAEMKEKLSGYYTTPDLTITPQDLAGQQYYVLGEVSKPGKFSIKAETTVLEAISSAGGINNNAGESVLLLRKQKNNLLIKNVPLQYVDVTAENILSVTMRVHTGDILYMPPSTIANIENFATRLNSILSPILSLERGIIFWPELIDVIEGSSEGQEFVVPLQ